MLTHVNDQQLESRPAHDILEWAAQTFGRDLAVACSFGGPTGMVLIDMLAGIDRTIPIYYLDTGLLFPQTYEHIARVAEHYKIQPIPVRPTHSVVEQERDEGSELWEREPDRCCYLRKVAPQAEFLRGYRAWTTAIRHDQAPSRERARAVEYDAKFGLIKVCPFVAWTERDVWDYIRERRVPYNPLHDFGYPSVGCLPCTKPIRPGDDPRAGRWSGKPKLECGLHV